MGQKGDLVVMESAALMDSGDRKDHKDHRDCKDYKGCKACKGHRASPVVTAETDEMAVMAVMETMEMMDKMDEMGEMDMQVPMGGLEQRVGRAPKVIRDLLGLMADLEPTVVRAHEEFQGSPALEVHQARQVPKDLLDLQDHALRGRQAVAEDVTLMGEKL